MNLLNHAIPYRLEGVKVADIIILTGKLAYKEANHQASILREKGYNASVGLVNVDVAVFMNERIVANWVNERCNSVRGSIIVIPGGARVDPGRLMDVLACGGIKLVRGPLHISDLSLYIDALELDKWNLDKPVDQIVNIEKRTLVDRVYSSLILGVDGIKSMHSGITIPVRPPPFLPVAEVYTDSRLGLMLYERKIKLLTDKKYPIAVVGSVNNDADNLKKGVQLLEKEGFNGIIGIDANLSRKVLDLVKSSSVEILLSLDERRLRVLEERWGKRFPKDAIIVLTPSNPHSKPSGKVRSLKQGFRKAVNLGLERVIIDPILPPPVIGSHRIVDTVKIVESLTPLGAPIMLGLSNYVELVDADSPGVVFTLMQLSVEAGASLGLFSEESVKTQGVFMEAFKAAKMISYAVHTRKTPKDLGLSLLLLKSKKWSQPILEISEVEVLAPSAETGPIGEWDPSGSYNVILDQYKGLIYIKKTSQRRWIAATNWRTLTDYIIRNDTPTVGHAFYLGKELYKAELALRLGKDYIQDRPLFDDGN